MNLTTVENTFQVAALQTSSAYSVSSGSYSSVSDSSSQSVTGIQAGVTANSNIGVIENNQNTSDSQSEQLNPIEQKLQEISDKVVDNNESLVIEKDPNSRGFIYKTVDKTTGEVLKVWPEESFMDKVSSIQDVDTRGIVMNDLV